MAIEFLQSRPLQPDELEMIQQRMESGFDDITEIDSEVRAIVERTRPHLVAKLPPNKDE